MDCLGLEAGTTPLLGEVCSTWQPGDLGTPRKGDLWIGVIRKGSDIFGGLPFIP